MPNTAWQCFLPFPLLCGQEQGLPWWCPSFLLCEMEVQIFPASWGSGENAAGYRGHCTPSVVVDNRGIAFKMSLIIYSLIYSFCPATHIVDHLWA